MFKAIRSYLWGNPDNEQGVGPAAGGPAVASTSARSGQGSAGAFKRTVRQKSNTSSNSTARLEPLMQDAFHDGSGGVQVNSSLLTDWHDL
jgi:hypothetical protein